EIEARHDDADQVRCRAFERARVIAVITEREPITRILAHVGMPTDAPPLARARDPSDELDDDEVAAQLSLELGGAGGGSTGPRDRAVGGRVRLKWVNWTAALSHTVPCVTARTG